ncbi:transposase, partial [Sphingobacterium daejeonense]
ERSKLLRKAIYQIDGEYKESLPHKNESNDLDQELTYCKELQRVLEQDQAISEIPAVKEKLNLLKETIEDTKEYYLLSKDDQARLGYKSVDSSFFGYKTHLAMTEERIITAAVVTTGEKGDGPELPRLLEISQQNGMEVDTIIGDTAYSGKENLQLAKEQDIDIIAKLNPIISQGYRKQGNHFQYNKDAGMFVCPAGHLAI